MNTLQKGILYLTTLSTLIDGCSKQNTKELLPTVSNFKNNIEMNFFDTDLDGKTVERYQEIMWFDYGTGSSSKILLDIERDQMSEWEKENLDNSYQNLIR